MSKRSSKIPASRVAWKRNTKFGQRMINVDGEQFVIVEPTKRPNISQWNKDILKKSKELAGKEDLDRSKFEDPHEAAKWINLVFQTEKKWLKSKHPKKSRWSTPVYFFNIHSLQNRMMPEYLGVRKANKKELSEQGASKEKDVDELSSLMGDLSVKKEQEEEDTSDLSLIEESDDDDELSLIEESDDDGFFIEDSDDDVELTVVKGDETIHQTAYSDDDAASHISLNESDVEVSDTPLGEITSNFYKDPVSGKHVDPVILKLRYELTDYELEEWANGNGDINEMGTPYWSIPEVVIIKKANKIREMKKSRLEQYLRDRWSNEGKGVIMVDGTPIDDVIEEKMKELFGDNRKTGGRRQRKQRKTKRIGKKSKRHRKMGKRKTKKRKSMKKRTRKRR